jgi:hypothetical protein
MVMREMILDFPERGNLKLYISSGSSRNITCKKELTKTNLYIFIILYIIIVRVWKQCLSEITETLVMSVPFGSVYIYSQNTCYDFKFIRRARAKHGILNMSFKVFSPVR